MIMRRMMKKKVTMKRRIIKIIILTSLLTSKGVGKMDIKKMRIFINKKQIMSKMLRKRSFISKSVQNRNLALFTVISF